MTVLQIMGWYRDPQTSLQDTGGLSDGSINRGRGFEFEARPEFVFTDRDCFQFLGLVPNLNQTVFMPKCHFSPS